MLEAHLNDERVFWSVSAFMVSRTGISAVGLTAVEIFGMELEVLTLDLVGIPERVRNVTLWALPQRLTYDNAAMCKTTAVKYFISNLSS